MLKLKASFNSLADVVSQIFDHILTKENYFEPKLQTCIN